MDGWNTTTTFLLGFGLFSGAKWLLVSGRVTTRSSPGSPSSWLPGFPNCQDFHLPADPPADPRFPPADPAGPGVKNNNGGVGNNGCSACGKKTQNH